MNKINTRFYVPKDMSWDVNNNEYADLTPDDIYVVDKGTIVFNHSFEKTGVYDENGELCLESVLLRWGENFPKNASVKLHDTDFIDETVLYLGTGYVFSHFGHFLTEGIARFWPLVFPKYKNFKVAIAIKGAPDIPSFVRKILNALGVCDENIIVCHKDTTFSRVLIPKQSANIGVNILPITKRVYDAIAAGIKKPKIKTYKKIYMSRSAMNDNRTFGEEKIEKIFEKNGFQIIHPEQIPFEEQIALVKSCKELAGTAGSALHLAFFMKPGGRVIQIKRNISLSDNINIQMMICDVCGLDIDLIFGSIERTPTYHFTNAPQIIGITPYMLQFFKDNDFVYNTSDFVPDLVAWGKYSTQLRKYKLISLYKKIMNIPIRLIAVFGITKSGREFVREKLKHLFHTC